MRMRLIYALLLGMLIAGTVAMSANAAQPGRFSLGGGGGFFRLTNGGDSASTYPFQFSFGLGFQSALGDRTFWAFDVDFLNAYDDTTITSGWNFSGTKDYATAHFKATRLAVSINRHLFDVISILKFSGGVDAGLLIWKYEDPVGDTLIKVPGPNSELMDFKATEIIAGGQIGLELQVSPRVSLSSQFGADYLTGAGADFADAVNSDRHRILIRSRIDLRISFGGPQGGPEWRSQDAWDRPIPDEAAKERRPQKAIGGASDSDGDGVSDNEDACPMTPTGAMVNSSGCPVDGDQDGVPDGLDDCPNTDRAAIGLVDIFGCAVDADFDGFPDYADTCPQSPIGAAVDETGCPVDTDADGVPDGLDDCPNTLYGVDVDRFGCINLSMLDKPMVLNINYAPGSYEIDPIRKEMLDGLARVLNFVSDIKLEISGYTDNIGTSTANQSLSEKRANRVRDYLAILGIASERMTVFGRGESNFVADNQTSEGRAKNRRIEITFYR